MAPLPDDPLLRLYRDMLLIRRFEEKAGQLYGMGLIGGFCPLSIGHEAVSVGIEAIARPGDTRITGARCHGMALACGLEPGRVMAELLGRATGVSGGMGGAMHLYSKPHGFYGGHALPGAQVPLAVGLAFAQRHQGAQGAMTFCCLGDGAALQGQVSEAFDLARLWSLPLLFVIENNGPGDRGAPLQRARGCGLNGDLVDGSDVVALRDVARDAVAAIRAGRGPHVIEADVPRFRGHALGQSDAARGVDRRDRDDRDPVTRFALHLGTIGFGRDVLKAVEEQVRRDVSEATQFARDSPSPTVRTCQPLAQAGG